MNRFVFIIFIIVALIIGASYEYHKFQAIKKYYPDLTYTEYLWLEDKLRITPNDP